VRCHKESVLLVLGDGSLLGSSHKGGATPRFGTLLWHVILVLYIFVFPTVLHSVVIFS
jgi:hypothetical protein